MKTTTVSEALALLVNWSIAKHAGHTGLAQAFADEYHRYAYGCSMSKAAGVKCDLPIYFESMEGFKKLFVAMGIHSNEVDWNTVRDVSEYVASPA